MFEPLFSSTQAAALAAVREALVRDPASLDNRSPPSSNPNQETSDGKSA